MQLCANRRAGLKEATSVAAVDALDPAVAPRPHPNLGELRVDDPPSRRGLSKICLVRFDNTSIQSAARDVDTGEKVLARRTNAVCGGSGFLDSGIS
jgi:hypothetical protein